jgi:hypothetical protein
MLNFLRSIFGKVLWIGFGVQFGGEKKEIAQIKHPEADSPNMIKTKILNFVNALRFTRDRGFNDYCVLTHAFHESGKFIKTIGGHNYWGIKKPRKWSGKIHDITTHEFTKILKEEDEEKAIKRIRKLYGRKDIKITRSDNYFWLIKLKQTFIDFDNLFFALSWYCSFIERMYPNAYNNRHNPIEYFNGLVNGNLQYATDPRYVDKLIATYEFLQFYQEYTYIKEAIEKT